MVDCDTKLRDRCKGTTCNRWRLSSTRWLNTGAGGRGGGTFRRLCCHVTFLSFVSQVWVSAWLPGDARKSGWNWILRHGNWRLYHKQSLVYFSCGDVHSTGRSLLEKTISFSCVIFLELIVIYCTCCLWKCLSLQFTPGFKIGSLVPQRIQIAVDAMLHVGLQMVF